MAVANAACGGCVFAIGSSAPTLKTRYAMGRKLPNKTYVSNVDRVMAHGIELAWNVRDWPFKGLAFDGNAAYTEAKVAEVYGGASRVIVNQVDLRLSCKLGPQWEWATGINNASNTMAYQSHPYPGRTVFAELRFSR